MSGIKHNQEIINSLKKELNSKIDAEDLKNITDEILKENDQLVGSMSEYMFTNVFILYFLGIKNIYNVNINTWINLVLKSLNVNEDRLHYIDALSIPVNIHDNNGNVLYTVPPFISKDFIHPDFNNSKYKEMVINFQQDKIISPILANNLLSKSLEKVNLIKKDDDKIKKYKDTWNKICARYKLPEIYTKPADIKQVEPDNDNYVEQEL